MAPKYGGVGSAKYWFGWSKPSTTSAILPARSGTFSDVMIAP
jgi:hypothetical protein